MASTSSTAACLLHLAAKDVAGFIKGSKKVCVLTGAGITTAAGIPDFRSPGGLYDTLRPELLTADAQQRSYLSREPTGVVDIRLFSVNQFPYLEVRRPFILGTFENKWKPTLGHFFIRLLHDQGHLSRLYTQNIDGLDKALGIPDEKIINFHGCLHDISCEFCKTPYDKVKFLGEVKTKIKNIYDPCDKEAPPESSNIKCDNCHKNGIKPSTVMYGSSIPAKVFRAMEADFPDNCDLLIVAGTSLTVAPACNLVNQVSPGVRRIVVNREPVGEQLGLNFQDTSSRDILLSGDSDSEFLSLAIELGWLPALHDLKEEMCPQSKRVVEDAFKTLSESGSGK